jgi:hypothetical protein
MRPKSKTCSFIILSALASSAHAVDAYYTIEQWPSDLNSLPCAAFVKAPNGGWGLAGTIVVRSSNEVLSESFYVRGNAVADIIENKCGNPFDPLHLKIEGTTRTISDKLSAG